LRIQGQNIELLSLEGWCTYLIVAVELSFWSKQFTDVRDEFWERWQELKAWDCSPWPYMEYLDANLAAPPPKLHKKEKRLRGFDPDEVTVSFRFASGIDPFLPGFACIRLFEQIGIPMRVPGVDIAGKTLKNACTWVAPFTGFLSPALMVRAGKPDAMSRTEVAVMDPVLAQRIYDWCFRVLKREIAAPAVRKDSSQASLIKVCVEVLSHLSLRLENEQLKLSFSLALLCRRVRVARQHIPIHDALMDWFKRLFHAADELLLTEWLPDLIREPFLNDDLHPVFLEPYKWPEPLSRFPSNRLPGTAEPHQSLVASINSAITWLLQRAESESNPQRRWACLRLVRVCSAPWMLAEQRRRLGELLWAQRGKHGLPDILGLTLSGLLELPAPADIDVAAMVKKHLLSLMPRCAVSRAANGRIMVTHFMGGSLHSEAADASRPMLDSGVHQPYGIEWTADEARQLFHKVLAWWANDKAAFGSESPLTSNLVLGDSTGLDKFLMRVVLPRIDAMDDREWRNVVELLEETRAVGIYCTEALPYVLLRRPGEFTFVTNSIRNDLYSDSEGSIDAGARALRQWLRLSAATAVQPAPPTLLQAIIERVVFRMSPGVGRCVVELALLIEEMPDVIDASQSQVLTTSLSAWERATRIQTVDDDWSGEFDISECPGLQARIGRLARALTSRHVRLHHEQPIPAQLQLWRDLCSSSPLPEVRRAFRPFDDLSMTATSPDREPLPQPSAAADGEPLSTSGRSGVRTEVPPTPTVH
jgi:hypothetical protein